MRLPDRTAPLLKRVKRRAQRALSSRWPLPNWQAIISANPQAWAVARTKACGPHILIATSTGGHQSVTPLEGMLAVALTLRGARVHLLLCDEFLPACLQAMSFQWHDGADFARQGPRKLCADCFRSGRNSYESLGLPIHRYSELVSSSECDEARKIIRSVPVSQLKEYTLDGLAVGEHAMAGALRFFATGDLSGEPHGEAVARRYFEASLLTIYAMRRLLTQHHFECAVFHHGIYVPQGLVGEVCRQRSVRVVNWVPAYRTSSFIFSHDDTYHHTLMTEPTSTWEHLEWTEELQGETLDYLRSRWQGTRDWIYFHEQPKEDLEHITRELGIRFEKPTIGMLTNVMWDAQLHYPTNAFPNMLDWVLRTIAYFAERPDLQLLIRVHPAELRGSVPSRQPIMAEIQKAYPRLPANVFIVPPQSQISTYVAMLQCDSVIIYGTKTGVELASLGIPIIVAGEAWIRGKGITIDVRSVKEYLEILDQLPLGQRLDEVTIRRARIYAYHFFFRRMIPLKFVGKTRADLRSAWGWWPYELKLGSVEDLSPGRDLGLDTICEGILYGKPFVYPAERAGRDVTTAVEALSE